MTTYIGTRPGLNVDKELASRRIGFACLSDASSSLKTPMLIHAHVFACHVRLPRVWHWRMLASELNAQVSADPRPT